MNHMHIPTDGCIKNLGVFCYQPHILNVVKTWLQLILRKNYINDNYTKCVRPIFTKLGTMPEQRSVNIFLHFVAMEPVT